MTLQVIDLTGWWRYNLGFAQETSMRFIVPAVLLLVALIHALPLAGVLGAPRLQQLYGIAVQDEQVELLLRHRAVLFGLLAAFLAYAAFEPTLHVIGVLGGLASVGAFLLLAWSVDGLGEPLARVQKVDAWAMVLLLIAALVLAWQRYPKPGESP